MPVVRLLGTQDYPLWNQLVATAPEGNVFLRSEWLQMLCETDPRLRFLIIGCFDDRERLLAGQALTYWRKWGLNIAAHFEFFYDGPLLARLPDKGTAHQAAHATALFSALQEAVTEQVEVIEVETHPALHDIRPFLYGGWQAKPLYTHLWRMERVESVWADMNREKRREIGHAQRIFTFGADESEQAVSSFLELYAETMQKFSWRPSVEWEDIFRQRFRWMRERDGCRLYLARTAQGKTAAGVVVLLSREDGTAYLWRQGSAEVQRESGVVPALYWAVASDVANEFATINFGGSPQPSLGAFKDYLGATPTLHFQLNYCSRPLQLHLLEQAWRLKDHVYNLGMGVYEPLRRLRGRGAKTRLGEPVFSSPKK